MSEQDGVTLQVVSGDLNRLLEGETVNFSHIVSGYRLKVTAEEIDGKENE